MAEPETTFAWPRSVHRAWLWSVVLAYLAAGVGFLLGPGLGIMLAIPATLALLAHPRRPALFLPAAVIVIGSIFVITMFTLPLLLLGLIWFWAHHRIVGTNHAGVVGSLVAVVLWLGAVGVTIVHLDPTCVQTIENGPTQAFDPATRGYETGWVWDVDSTVTGGGSAEPGAVVSDSCVSDTVVFWEGAAGILLAVGSVYLGWRLTPPIDREDRALLAPVVG